MSNNRWYIILILFASPLLLVLFFAYFISFVAFADVDNTDQLVSNLSQIHSAITDEPVDEEIGEFSPANIADEATINSSIDSTSSQTTAERLANDGYKVLYLEDVNGDDIEDIVAIEPVELDLSEDYADYQPARELKIFTEHEGIGLGWPLFVFDDTNFPPSIIEIDQPPKNNLFAIKTSTDPNERIQFHVCPLDHQGQNIAQCFGIVWDGSAGQYDFYGGGKNPDWEALK